jgi:hypothetical protein
LGTLGSISLSMAVAKIVVRKNLDLNSPVSREPRAGQVLKLQPLAANGVASKVYEFTSI